MKNNILTQSLEDRDCTGCSMCEVVCPTKAINIELIKEGFYEPSVNHNLCINCSLCKKICYKYDENILNDNEQQYFCYSAINKDDSELKTSTSGGVSIELMKECINAGYKVVGVAYDYEQDIAVTKVASEIYELEQFKGSKYFQSYTVSAFEEVINDKSSQHYAIFGTPCQIYALAKYFEIKKNRDKFLLVDIFCHGCPSINLWNKYLQSKKEELKIDKFDKIEFRSKAYGWHEYAITFIKDNKRYNSKRLNDPFYEIFFDKNIFSKACYSCKLRSTLRYTDIRIGDFWGYQYAKDSKGVSAVIACTQYGKEFLENIKEKFEINEHKLLDVIRGQSYGKIHKFNEERYGETLKLMTSDSDMKKIINIYRLNYSVNKRLKIKLKNTIKLLPRKLYLNLKYINNKRLEKKYK